MDLNDVNNFQEFEEELMKDKKIVDDKVKDLFDTMQILGMGMIMYPMGNKKITITIDKLDD